jgi:hypothetical protein
MFDIDPAVDQGDDHARPGQSAPLLQNVRSEDAGREGKGVGPRLEVDSRPSIEKVDLRERGGAADRPRGSARRKGVKVAKNVGGIDGRVRTDQKRSGGGGERGGNGGESDARDGREEEPRAP